LGRFFRFLGWFPTQTTTVSQRKYKMSDVEDGRTVAKKRQLQPRIPPEFFKPIQDWYRLESCGWEKEWVRCCASAVHLGKHKLLVRHIEKYFHSIPTFDHRLADALAEWSKLRSSNKVERAAILASIEAHPFTLWWLRSWNPDLAAVPDTCSRAVLDPLTCFPCFRAKPYPKDLEVLLRKGVRSDCIRRHKISERVTVQVLAADHLPQVKDAKYCLRSKIQICVDGKPCTRAALRAGLLDDLNDEAEIDVSHLCHNRTCIYWRHGVPESREANLTRGFCSGPASLEYTCTHEPSCLVSGHHKEDFPGPISGSYGGIVRTWLMSYRNQSIDVEVSASFKAYCEGLDE